ncbi:hypothetical protein ACJ2A9_04000 [Anaerobacillus sp. MEB173]|uniref:hypothetical protein n=1 Tax=Anaerobacillus sp. MEB173 TaxID=3383345 RepID=UPI003F9229E6
MKVYEMQTRNMDSHKMLFIVGMEQKVDEIIFQEFGITKDQAIIHYCQDAVIDKSYDSVVRNIVKSIYEEDVSAIYVIGEKDDQGFTLTKEELLEKMKADGVADDTIRTMDYLKFVIGKDLYSWLKGEDKSMEEKIVTSVSNLKKHPLIPKRIKVQGLLFDETYNELVYVSERKKEKIF